MIINRANLTAFQMELDVEYGKALKDSLPDDKSLAKALFYEKTALGRKKVEYPWISAGARIVKLGKGEPQEIQKLPMNKLSIEAGRMSLLLGIDEFDLECDEEGLYVDFVRSAGAEQADYYELRAAALVTGGFTTQTPDQAKYYFDTGRRHSADLGANSATYDNKIVDVLGATGYQKARTMLMNMTDGKGKPRGLGARGFVLTCGPANEAAARTLLEATIVGNNTNIYASKDTQLVVSPYYGTSTAWTLSAKTAAAATGRPLIKQINAPWRSRMTGTNDTSTIVNGEILYQNHARGEEAYGDPSLIIGSTGAGA